MKQLIAGLTAVAALAAPAASQESACEVEVHVLGIGQDGGAPQLGAFDDPAWDDPEARLYATSLGLVDHRTGERWLFEATPDMRPQVHALTVAAGARDDAPLLDGIFLTHAHIGHYAGLVFLGHESLGASGIVVHAMPRMAGFLRDNGPWSQLVAYGNIALSELAPGAAVDLGDEVSVTPFLVPHRQEFSEVVGYRIEGPEASALFLPDIDSWEDWDAMGVRIEDAIAEVDIAFLDATFFADGEIPGRDMSGFPHPFIRHSMDRFADLAAAERAKVRFIHLNHTNPARDPDGDAAQEIRARGFGLARRGETICLLEAVD
ncbi:pyrroloquinoline quinone biosynthesis protein PqqB [Marinicauda salina]|uniref:Pyrroloquinoline quinone biosynthesis protein PqqB n=1 Tax=Marinicauda salina TaxID=2135793 RepID=A0A2U2BSH3_9PROT|nr:MBL fold metallo-hydrolase [Marinicauda salina]PWE16963.1 pyrroloquinoline quinone biosynthesis protein PqqB [Marinicauda salina]